ncbi:MAG: cobaltochelatase subunit CobN, partial [Candidatus Hydrogenedentota bacterium]
MHKVIEYTKGIVWNRYAVIVLVVLLSSLWIWRAWLSPTHIGLVNYREFQYAQMADIDDLSPFVRISRISPDELTQERLDRYAGLFVFGMGLNLSPEQQDAMNRAAERGTGIYLYGATGDVGDIASLSSADHERIDAYMRNGGQRNIRSMFHYIRRHVDGKRFLAGQIDPPQEMPGDRLYHRGDDAIFGSVEEYQTFYEESGAYNPEAPRVAFITTIVGQQSAGQGYTDAIIEAFESRNINIYPISASHKRLDFLREIDPDLVVYAPHGRLAPGRTQEALAWLEEQDVPLLTPVDVLAPYDEWVQSQEGSAGPPMGQGIVTPELDGGIEPYAISAQFPNEDGLHVFKGVPQRIETFADRVERWLTLQRKPNEDKRLAIVYFRGPGANAMVAGGLEVAPSLFNTLQHLEEEGFDTGDLPETEEEFWNIIQEKGKIIGPYAQGAFEEFLSSGEPALIAAETYLEWVQQHLEPEMYSAVEDQYGPAPGQYLSTQKDEKPYLAIPRIEFGNIALMPQLLPSVGDDEAGMIHGADQAPPHPYIAQYLWAREGFQADALMHFGTHGSLEFTPWRQVALSQYDWPDALVGDLPHTYVYVINNVGEAMIAKRRSYAVINSHLTPPFMESDLHGEFAALHDSLHDYMLVEDDAVRQAHAERIIDLVKESGVAEDLRLEDLSAETFDADLFDQIHNYVHEIGHEQITEGLYTIGEAYTEEQVRDTVRQMSIDPLSYSMARLDILEGVQDEGILDDLHSFEREYREPAMEKIDALLAGEAEPGDFLSAEHEEVMGDQIAAEQTGGEDSGQHPSGMPEGMRGDETDGPDPMVREILEHGVEDGPAADLLLAMDEDALEAGAETWGADRIRTFLHHIGAFTENRAMAAALEAHEEQGMDAVAAILQSDTAMEQISSVANRMEQRLAQEVEYERVVTTLVETLYGVKEYHEAIEASPQKELDSVVAALSGRFIAPSAGGDPISTPKSVPTGRNLYSIDPARTPSEAAWSVGKDLAEQLIESQVARNGAFPQRTAMTLWGGEFIRSQGINVAQALYLMGVRPVWNSHGMAHDVELIPSDELNRPRIDVVVQ